MNSQVTNGDASGENQNQLEAEQKVNDTENAIEQLQRAEEMADQLEVKLDSFLGNLEKLLSTLEPKDSKHSNSGERNRVQGGNDSSKNA